LDPLIGPVGSLGPAIPKGVSTAPVREVREPTDEELLECMNSLPSNKDPQKLFNDIECKKNQESIKPLEAVRCVRLVVLDVIDDAFNRRKNLICFIASSPIASGGSSGACTTATRTIQIAGYWYNNTINGGDTIHILDLNMKSFLNNSNKTENKGNSIFKNEKFSGHNMVELWAVVDDEKGLLIIHPDMLISPTKIVEAMGCTRRGVLSERVKSFGGSNKAAVMGNLKHFFIESAIEICLSRLSYQNENIIYDIHNRNIDYSNNANNISDNDKNSINSNVNIKNNNFIMDKNDKNMNQNVHIQNTGIILCYLYLYISLSIFYICIYI
jgi:hypothetical protein